MSSRSAVISLVNRKGELELRCDENLPKTLDGMISATSLRQNFQEKNTARSYVLKSNGSKSDNVMQSVIEELASNNWNFGSKSERNGPENELITTIYLHKSLDAAKEIIKNHESKHDRNNNVGDMNAAAFDVISPEASGISTASSTGYQHENYNQSNSYNQPQLSSYPIAATQNTNNFRVPTPKRPAPKLSSTPTDGSLKHLTSSSLSPKQLPSDDKYGDGLEDWNNSHVYHDNSPSFSQESISLTQKSLRYSNKAYVPRTSVAAPSRGSSGHTRLAEILIKDILSPTPPTPTPLSSSMLPESSSNSNSNSNMLVGMSGASSVTDVFSPNKTKDKSVSNSSDNSHSKNNNDSKNGTFNRTTATFASGAFTTKPSGYIVAEAYDDNKNLQRIRGIRASREIQAEEIQQLQQELKDMRQKESEARTTIETLLTDKTTLEDRLLELQHTMDTMEGQMVEKGEELVSRLWSERVSAIEDAASARSQEYFSTILRKNNDENKKEAEKMAASIWEKKKTVVMNAALRKAEVEVRDRIQEMEMRVTEADERVARSDADLLQAAQRLREALQKAEIAESHAEENAKKHAEHIAARIWSEHKDNLAKDARSEAFAYFETALEDTEKVTMKAASDQYESRITELEARHASQLQEAREQYLEELKDMRETIQDEANVKAKESLNEAIVASKNETREELENYFAGVVEKETDIRIGTKIKELEDTISQKDHEIYMLKEALNTSTGGNYNNNNNNHGSSQSQLKELNGDELNELAISQEKVRQLEAQLIQAKHVAENAANHAAENIWSIKREEILNYAEERAEVAARDAVVSEAAMNAERRAKEAEDSVDRRLEEIRQRLEAQVEERAEVRLQQLWKLKGEEVHAAANQAAEDYAANHAEKVAKEMFESQVKNIRYTAKWKAIADVNNQMEEMRSKVEAAEKRAEAAEKYVVDLKTSSLSSTAAALKKLNPSQTPSQPTLPDTRMPLSN